MSKEHETPRPRVALYQPDIPGNTGTILRLAACLDIPVDLIEPAGFRLDDISLRRAGLDYLERARLVRHACWDTFSTHLASHRRRLVLLTTQAEIPYTEFTFTTADTLLFGRESGGVPNHIHESADARLTIPMARGERSLNLAVSVAMVAGEVQRQTGWMSQTGEMPNPLDDNM